MFYNVIVGGGRSLSKTYSSSLFRRQNIFRIPITKKKTSSFRFYLKIKTKFSIEKKTTLFYCYNATSVKILFSYKAFQDNKIDMSLK